MRATCGKASTDYYSGMISVVIPTLNAERHLGPTLSALVPAAIDGLIREVVIVDGGSADATCRIADEAGARVVKSAPGRGQQLAAGAREAKGRWLLFLHADTVLAPGWEEEAFHHVQGIERVEKPDRAAAFRFRLDDDGMMAGFLQAMVALRCRVLRTPYGDQGLLISRRLYTEAGGYTPIALMEDVDLIRRLGRGRVALLRAAAVTSASRYLSDGYLRRMLRNLTCLGLFYLRVPPRLLARIYG
jgi:rSAM/selenodomain-associated transferase 2